LLVDLLCAPDNEKTPLLILSLAWQAVGSGVRRQPLRNR
jgi:hypothetical protein